LDGVRPVTHGAVGGAELAERGARRDGVIDFSASTNPLGPSPAVLEALRALGSAELGRYPDPAAGALCRALAERLGVGHDALLAGNGTSELIWLMALAYARGAPERVLISGPAYGEYERACRIMGSAVETEAAREADAFRPDVDRLAEHVRRERPRIVWLCNPNNPTGTYLTPERIERVLAACVEVGCLLVVDEAYLAFVEHGRSAIELTDSAHAVVLRSMTKDYALTGLRLGYAVAAPDLVARLRLVQPPWSVGAPAQAAGMAALRDEAHLERSRREVWAARALLVDGLAALDYRALPPAANFVLVDVGPRWESAAALRAALFARGCVVRDCASFGLPRHVRIGVRTKEECARLLAALREVSR
ncbi:MAG TPA: histidinol-phosphate transaminase, partial [Chloroflexota bacterium]|nr:histidinol-phosphate transaminase [Chloroflexota bacterium]